MSKYDNGDSGKSSEAATLTRRRLLKTSALGAAAARLRRPALYPHARSKFIRRTQSPQLVGRVSGRRHSKFREGDRHQGQFDAVLAE